MVFRTGIIHICRLCYIRICAVFSTIIINIGHIKWGTSWGKVLGSAGTSTVLSTLGINYTTVKVPAIVIRYYTPAQAMFFHFCLWY